MTATAYMPPQYCYVNSIVLEQYTKVASLSSSITIEDSQLINRFLRYQLLRDSFMSHGGNCAPKDVVNAFDEIAQEIGAVTFNKAQVEYSPIMEMIQFSLSFVNGMRLSFGKPLDESKSKEVCFSLSVNNEVLVVDKKSIEDLKDVLVETIEK